MNFIIGSKGRVGRSVVSGLQNEAVDILDRSVYSHWWQDDAVDEIARYLDARRTAKSVVYVASGIIDQARPLSEHHQVNFLLSRNVVEASSLVGVRAVTFGTVLEKIACVGHSNPYFDSKTRLGEFVASQCAKSKGALHIQMHTLFGGGPPDRFMFLGQMFASLSNRTPFEMSMGKQLREYHHVDDAVTAVIHLGHSDATGVIDLSHGSPVTLKELATHVFEQFGHGELLRVGARPEPDGDNYEVRFERTPYLKDVGFKPTLSSIVDYLRACLCEANPAVNRTDITR